MVEIYGKHYYIDIDAVMDSCKIEKPIVKPATKSKGDTENIEINIFKYEILKLCLERVLSEYEEVDEELGELSQKDSSISFRIGFNTLLKYDILIDDYE
jgi:hypothetical protein